MGSRSCIEDNKDLISRHDAIRIVDGIDTWQAGWRGEAIESIKALPPAQPERKKGKWIKAKNWGIRCYQCNQCGNYLDFDGVNAGRGDANFCPNCGADMRGGTDE